VQSSSNELRDKIKGYYSALYGSDIRVNKTMYLANGTNTTNATEAASAVYHIVVKKLITGSSVSNVMLIK